MQNAKEVEVPDQPKDPPPGFLSNPFKWLWYTLVSVAGAVNIFKYSPRDVAVNYFSSICTHGTYMGMAMLFPKAWAAVPAKAAVVKSVIIAGLNKSLAMSKALGSAVLAVTSTA